MIKKFNEFITEKKNEKVDKKLIDQYGKYKVYTVNGETIRNLSKKDEEFGLSYSFKYFGIIPKNEIWIEDDVKENERPILIYIELYKLKLIDSGMEKWDAYHKAEKMDKKLREKMDKNSNKKVDDNIYKKEYCKIKDAEVTVWLVDGEKVRDNWKSDFMEGGHNYVYKWIPNNEIWIEDGLKDKEIPFILIHEFVERTLMKEKKMKYDDAHNIAAKVEWNKRPNGVSKLNMENMTEEDALKLGNEFKK